MSATEECPRQSVDHLLTDHKRVAPIDGLRTIAIAFVVLYHLNVPFFDGEFIGVNIFFALSGYLITSILLRERRNTGRIALGSFWSRRAIRLYPTLLVVVIVVSCLWTAISAYSKSNVDVGTDALLALRAPAHPSGRGRTSPWGRSPGRWEPCNGGAHFISSGHHAFALMLFERSATRVHSLVDLSGPGRRLLDRKLVSCQGTQGVGRRP